MEEARAASWEKRVERIGKRGVVRTNIAAREDGGPVGSLEFEEEIWDWSALRVLFRPTVR